jgi:hypothetical protein
MSRKIHGTESVPLENCLSGGVHPRSVCQMCAGFRLESLSHLGSNNGMDDNNGSDVRASLFPTKDFAHRASRSTFGAPAGSVRLG